MFTSFKYLVEDKICDIQLVKILARKPKDLYVSRKILEVFHQKQREREKKNNMILNVVKPNLAQMRAWMLITYKNTTGLIDVCICRK